MPRTCGAKADCPPVFAFDAAACARMTRETDGTCDLGYCVEGACHDALGTCTYPGA